MKKKFKSGNKNSFILILFLILIVSTVFIIFNIKKHNFPFIPTKNNKATEEGDFILNEDNLVGIWQDWPSMASGWSNHYNFYDSGKYTLFFNEMDCAKTVESESGFWQIEGSLLTLNPILRVSLNGGKLIPASGSCASSKMLDGAKVAIEKIKDSEVKTYEITIPDKPVSVGGHEISKNDFPMYQLITIDNVPYWKFSDNPAGDTYDSFSEPTGF